MPFVLQGQLLRRAQTLDRDRGLRGDRAQTEDVCIAVGLGPVTLDGDHAEHAIAGADRNDEARLGRDELTRLGPVEQTDRGPFR